MQRFLILLFCLFHSLFANAQHRDSIPTDLYKVNYKWEVPVSVAFLAGSYFGFRALDKYASYTAEDIKKLNPNNINAFDRPVAFYDPAHFDRAQKTSDMFLNIAVASPVVLLLDKRIRRDWADFLTMFVLAHSVDNVIYFGSVRAFRRARPLTYNPGLSIEQKTGEAKSNSFFSGHVSFSATSTFFAAKLYTDHHHIKGWKRLAIFTGAAIPPALVGYYRMKAGKHFKTDVMTGLLIGGATGIGIPALHRNRNKEDKLSLQPFFMQGYNGFTLCYNIK